MRPRSVHSTASKQKGVQLEGIGRLGSDRFIKSEKDTHRSGHFRTLNCSNYHLVSILPAYAGWSLVQSVAAGASREEIRKAGPS